MALETVHEKEPVSLQTLPSPSPAIPCVRCGNPVDGNSNLCVACVSSVVGQLGLTLPVRRKRLPCGCVVNYDANRTPGERTTIMKRCNRHVDHSTHPRPLRLSILTAKIPRRGTSTKNHPTNSHSKPSTRGCKPSTPPLAQKCSNYTPTVTP